MGAFSAQSGKPVYERRDVELVVHGVFPGAADLLNGSIRLVLLRPQREWRR